MTIQVKIYGTLRYYKEIVEKYISGEKVEFRKVRPPAQFSRCSIYRKGSRQFLS